MSKPMEESDSTNKDDDGHPSPMDTWERWTAGVIGLVAGGAGGAAVFLSDNQAGTAALFIVAAAFLLIGVQGTPLRRFGSGEHSAEFERFRKARTKLQDAKEAKRAGDQEIAEILVDDAVRIDPSVENLPVVQEVRYERRAADALRRASSRIPELNLTTAQVRDGAADFVLLVNGHYIDVVVKHRRGELGVPVFQSYEQEARRTGRPTLVITNAPLSDAVMQLNGRDEDTPVEVVQWSGGNDDDLLTRAILRLAR
ncbi:hypothetical protein [Rhodococcus sp. M8-35]|uniref:hypothetical protein n=1 Tax=Rhodococcus sp. M8-35 TaxID=3058401 RepID=UPI002ED66FDE